ncbi:MAG TPA: glycosyltransferase family 4 protein [Thermoanaerobaculia bacterium]|nr:glycosyltransferase family 4 protein [Thermoanaerobaculia bacterium]
MRNTVPLRVLLVANTLPPRDVSGVGEQVLQLATGLREAGCEVEVLGRGPGGAAGSKLVFPLTAVPATLQAARRFRPHVVQVHESDGGLVAWAVARAGRRLQPEPLLVALLQVSYVEERHAVRPLVAPDGRVLGRPGAVEHRFRWLKAPLQIALGRLTARMAGRVLAPSAVTAAEIERDYRVQGVRVVPNVTGALPMVGLDAVPESAPDRTVDPEARPAPSPSAAPSAAGAERGHLLFVGRLRIRKGVEVLLEAVAARLAAGGAPRLRIAGDGEHRPALEERARELGLGSAVTFLGRCDAARVRELLTGARALVVPSTYEGMPLVVLEAMEAGVPVVASRVSGIPEVVVDGESGWLVPPEDPDALAAVLAALEADPEEARHRGEAGRRRVEERFRPHHAAAAWLAALGLGPSVPG